eukprot:1146805-Pelagomonas_calceolata.AAC.9
MPIRVTAAHAVRKCASEKEEICKKSTLLCVNAYALGAQFDPKSWVSCLELCKQFSSTGKTRFFLIVIYPHDPYPCTAIKGAAPERPASKLPGKSSDSMSGVSRSSAGKSKCKTQAISLDWVTE